MTVQIPKDTRSGLNPENLQEVLDAGASAKHATLAGQQQYSTPTRFAELFNSLLPAVPTVAFDPQCAAGNTIRSGMGSWVRRFGFELDRRYAADKTDDDVTRVIGNCVTSWEMLDELFPALRFECQNANPPFGLLWPTADGKRYDSTEYTWNKIIQRAEASGYGWFISNHKTIERLGINKHPWVYLYQKFPKGVWEQCDVEIGVVHWDASNQARLKERLEVQYVTLDFSEHAEKLALIRKHYRDSYHDRDCDTLHSEIREAFQTLNTIYEEERTKRPPFNVFLHKDETLRTYLSTRFTVKRKISREEVLRLAKINKCHPITLTTERESRKILAELVSAGIYTVQPEAKKAIEDALAEVGRMSAPIMPITDFESVAHADEEDTLLCIADHWRATDTEGSIERKRIFTNGQRYELKTASYVFKQGFKRNKPHWSEATQEMTTLVHDCVLSGTDRYIAIQDDNGRVHRFMDRPQSKAGYDHDEKELWTIFKKPDVKTVAEVNPKQVEHNKLVLSTCEMLADFTFYPGQLDYLSRVGCKDYGIVAGAVGTGKTLMAISLIQMKSPMRALIVAPQGTMRSSSSLEEDEDDEDEVEQQASQWLQELHRFAPGMPVFQLFSMDDYHRILSANNGKLPPGVYVSYYEAMFSNGARETAASSWNDERLEKECRKLLGSDTPKLPEPFESTLYPDRFWCNTVGQEHDGIRCIMQPCMSTLIGHNFDMVCLDEGHRCCNLGANVSQMLIRLQPKYRYVFTATPIPNIVANLFSLMGWVCVEGWYKGNRRNVAWPYARGEIARFIDTFQAEERDFTQEELNAIAAKAAGNTRYKGTKCIKVSPIISSPARLLKILKPSMAYISKPMCRPEYQEPKLVDVRVAMGTQQTKLYAHFMNRGNIQAKNPLVRARKQITYLRNICADPAGFSHGGPKVLSNFNPKTLTILELSRDIINRGDQVVIVCARVGQTNTLHMALRDAGVLVSRIDSTITAEQHSHQSNMFKAKRTQVCLFGIKCAAGYSFDECPNMIVGSLEYSYGSLEQARGRVDRVNSKYPRTIYCVLHRHSLEEVMFDVVATKQDAATICLRGQRVPREFKPVDSSEVLAQALDEFTADGSKSESECEGNWPKLRETFSVDNFNSRK